jgi:hypothetical protein
MEHLAEQYTFADVFDEKTLPQSTQSPYQMAQAGVRLG